MNFIPFGKLKIILSHSAFGHVKLDYFIKMTWDKLRFSQLDKNSIRVFGYENMCAKILSFILMINLHHWIY